jgi:hypothetical protein
VLPRASSELQRRDDGERRNEAGVENPQGVERVQQLPAGRNSRIHELVVESDRRRQQNEQREDETAQWITEESPTGRARQHGVPDDVRRQEPEVDERMAEPPEQHPREHRIDGLGQAERPGDQLEEHLGRHADGREQPHDDRGCEPMHRQRDRPPAILSAPEPECEQQDC